ncbi:MAG: MmcQ/YjbR family DNA-binding protein [Sporocytophaga sp.]|uniref:MmcQ/YjbR family DNA-binding protein n=1 Tax=Sporocytophaga sp. TaxID=2231183 RepID=UPI001B25A943|nr:MmcQ/YjbR family DNA-binding protein [Sporocytophaga sp.]MBO9702702.1 MmcQ/YjbR family DNA-binding protein [Sporocytophaga sp.]
MNIEDFRSYCLAKKGVTEEFPFGEETLVFKVMGKMFALTDVDLFASVNLKCDPEEAEQLRESYPAIQPGYHMNKKHWNTVDMDGSLDDKFICGLIDQSYDLVVKGLTKTQKELLTKL